MEGSKAVRQRDWVCSAFPEFLIEEHPGEHTWRLVKHGPEACFLQRADERHVVVASDGALAMSGPAEQPEGGRTLLVTVYVRSFMRRPYGDAYVALEAVAGPPEQAGDGPAARRYVGTLGGRLVLTERGRPLTLKRKDPRPPLTASWPFPVDAERLQPIHLETGGP